MSKVTSKRQVTLPKALADQYGIRPGDEIQWEAAGEVIRVYPSGKSRRAEPDVDLRLRLFDEGTERQKRRNQDSSARPRERGWTREELYERGLSD